MDYPKKSYWHETADNKINKYTSTNDLTDKKYDVLIIGGGLTGLTIAYKLKDSGLNIGVIEASEICYGVSAYSTAKVTVQHDVIYNYLINSFGIDEAKKYLKANTEGLDLIRNIIIKNNISCDYKDQDAYVYATDDDELEEIKKEFKAYEKLNIEGFFTENPPLPLKTKGAIAIKNQGQFNPLKYLYCIYNILTEEKSCDIYEHTRAINIVPYGDYIVVETDKGDIQANKVVVATHYPFDDSFGLYFLRLYQEKEYVLAAKTTSPPFEGMYINVNDPVRSLRFHFSEKENVLILAGGSHRTGEKDDENDSYNELELYLKEIFKDAQIVSKWSTQDCMTYDKIPYIGLYSNSVDNLYVATGYKKWGITQSAAAAIILSNKIMGIKDDYSDIFNPSRVNPKQSYKEFFSSVKSILSAFAKRIAPAEDELNDIEIGEGKIVNLNGKKVGVYKNEDEKLLFINPVCAHLKCALSFNEAEKTWDCPCHGSRYDVYGSILEGPTVNPIDRIHVDK